MKSNKEILKFAFPAIIENFLQMLVGLSDTFLVARIGLSAVAAVSLANNIITVYQAIFIALGTMVASLFARRLAEKDSKKSQEQINSSVKLTIIVSLVLGVISLLLAYPITYLLGARGEVQKLAMEYFMLVGGLIILLGLMTTFGSFLRARGNTKTPMWASFFANVLNLILSAVFIFGLHFGVLGSALGAVIARTLGSLYLYIKLKQDRPTRGFFRTKIDKELIRLTIPATGERLSMRLGDLLVITLVMSLGSSVFAGNAIGESITQFNYMPVFGMATVTVILIAQEFGHQNMANIKTYIRRTYWLSTVMMLIIGAIILIFSTSINAWFTTDPTAAKASHTVILFSLLATFFVTGNSTYTAAFQGIGNPKLPFYTTTFGMFVIRVLLGTLFGLILPFGLEGIWFAVLLDNAFRFIFLKIKFQKTLIHK